MLCLWQASQSTEYKKPFFVSLLFRHHFPSLVVLNELFFQSQRCHNKSASDVRFLGHSSSVLVTAGASSGEFNLGLWDTLLPQNRALVHSWVAHVEGATVAMYLPNQQAIISGGRHGELCFWDVRQRQLRMTVKAFEPHQMIKTLVTDYTQDIIVAGSSDGDIKIWSADTNPQLMYVLPGEHATKGGFSFRQGMLNSVDFLIFHLYLDSVLFIRSFEIYYKISVYTKNSHIKITSLSISVAQSTVQGVQQLYIDQHMQGGNINEGSITAYRLGVTERHVY
uniref:WD_REPEATS_REGION domain-containing protein n=1 Tax=Heterorhabditis bacteriophora TaxID=37862 RepID=A0A1I7WD56_HETBA